jgi:hypothetical protein
MESGLILRAWAKTGQSSQVSPDQEFEGQINVDYDLYIRYKLPSMALDLLMHTMIAHFW